ncbi:MAG: hypothetical protein EOM52_03565 [Clostridia bacterium]|nr:hypothetical protein [Clostridia bacterium]
MEDKRKFSWLEPVKTLLIVLLAVSAVYLLTRTSLTDATGGGLFSSISSLLPGGNGSVGGAESELGSFVRPVRMAVMNGKLGRYGVQYDQETMDSKFGGALLNLVSDALSGASAPRGVSAQTWRSALEASERPGVYLDFLGSVPCADLSVWLGGRASNPLLTGEVRRLLLTSNANGDAILYYNNETDGSYYACDTSADLGTRLAAAVADFEPNGARFAFEDSAQYQGLASETLILTHAPTPQVYHVKNPIPSGSDELRQVIQSLNFHPQSNPVDLNDLLIREGTDTLRVSPSGVVSYYSASTENPRFPVGDSGAPTNAGMVEAAWKLLESCMTDRTGAARLYLAGLSEEDGGTAIYFGYQLNGVGVQVGSDGYAARLVIQDRRIAAFTLQLRSYEDMGTTSIVLPEVQAAAAMDALHAAGSELLLCYLDQGSEVRASWVAK